MNEVDIETFAEVRSRDVEILDVREPEEYVAGHVPGAKLIPMNQLPGRLGEVAKDRPVYVLCASGNRSAAMTSVLRSAGFNAYNVAGGTGAWVRAGRPVVQGRGRG